ncbi:unnamed protein product [Caenorhabditis auriculariae]|uniref:N-acetyltransferase domain-containing protein n=1 Tax=Caenorhabditis auriculariae TaxID=2777116 RepID=A0A8S1HIH0_9PELO|nr:unnamed protein product [Caenorhabditis auriculariae]
MTKNTQENWEQSYKKLKYLRKSADAVIDNTQFITKLFIEDLEKSMAVQLDGVFWLNLKTTIDATASSESAVRENAVNLCVCMLSDLCLVVQQNFILPEVEFEPMRLSSVLRKKTAKAVRKPAAMAFCAFVALRMGDLMRYKNELEIAKNLYTEANRHNPFDGAPLNQLGVLSSLSANWIEALYFHSLALHSKVPFASASANISNIFKRFSNRDTSKSMPFHELYLATLAKCHFLLEVEDDVLKSIGEKLETPQLLCPLLAVFANLNDQNCSKDEKRSLRAIETIWRAAFEVTVDSLEKKITTSRMACLSLLLRHPPFCRPAPKLQETLDQMPSSRFADSYRLNQFFCLHQFMMKYPLSSSQFVDLLSRLGQEGYDSSERDPSEEPKAARSRRRRTVLQAPHRGVAAFVASVSSSASSTAGSSTASPDASSAARRQLSPTTSVGSNGSRRSNGGMSAEKLAITIERPQAHQLDEIVEFLINNFVPTEPILASLRLNSLDELNIFLTDLVRDCLQCSSTNVARCNRSGQLNGICLASKAALFDMQVDRLCEYEFTDERICIAIEFLKYVFNKLDVGYHFEENGVTKPIFVAIVAVRKECWRNGIGTAMLESCLNSARDERCDGALALASSSRACNLINPRFPITISSIRYDQYRGAFRDPPIVPPPDEPNRALYRYSIFCLLLTLSVSKMRVIVAALAVVAAVSAYDAVLFSSEQAISSSSLDKLLSEATPEAPLIFVVNPDFTLGQFSQKVHAYDKASLTGLAKTIQDSKHHAATYFANQFHAPEASFVTNVAEYQPGASSYILAGEEWTSMDLLAEQISQKVKSAIFVLTATDAVSSEKSRVKRVVTDAMNEEADANSASTGSTGTTGSGTVGKYVAMPLLLPPYNVSELGNVVPGKFGSCLFYMEGLTVVVQQKDDKGSAIYSAIPVRSDNTTWGTAGDEDFQCVNGSVGSYIFTAHLRLENDANGLYDNKPAVSITKGSLIDITFNFTGDSAGYWSLVGATLHNIDVKGTGTFKSASVKEQKVGRDAVQYTGVQSVQGFSFACSETQAIFFNTSDPSVRIGIAMYNTQVQTFVSLANFDKNAYFTRQVDDCVGTFSPGSWMGIISALVLLGGLIFGYMMLQSVQTMDRFDDPKHKQIVINVRE